MDGIRITNHSRFIVGLEWSKTFQPKDAAERLSAVSSLQLPDYSHEKAIYVGVDRMDIWIYVPARNEKRIQQPTARAATRWE
jgi:hypothetical protein